MLDPSLSEIAAALGRRGGRATAQKLLKGKTRAQVSQAMRDLANRRYAKERRDTLTVREVTREEPDHRTK